MELLSEGIYEEAHAKVSSVRLGTEKAQKVEKAVKFEGDWADTVNLAFHGFAL